MKHTQEEHTKIRKTIENVWGPYLQYSDSQIDHILDYIDRNLCDELLENMYRGTNNRL